MKPALLIIDLQKAWFKDNPAATAQFHAAAEYINAAIELFREKKLPIICIQHLNPEDNVVPGQPGFDLVDGLNILPADIHIHKTYPNSFNKTTLAETLRQAGADAVIVTGFAAEGCVLATTRGAKDLDLTAIILRSAIIGGRPDTAAMVESISEIISYHTLCKVLG